MAPLAQRAPNAALKSGHPPDDFSREHQIDAFCAPNYNLTPEEYRAKWALPADYPMVAPDYAAQRSEFAKRIGLGRNAPGRKARRRG